MHEQLLERMKKKQTEQENERRQIENEILNRTNVEIFGQASQLPLLRSNEIQKQK